MIVYGDHVRVAAASNILDEIGERLVNARPDQTVAALILAGQLQQALEDAEMERRGVDDLTAIGQASGDLTLAVARLAGGFGDASDLDQAVERVRQIAPTGPLTLKQPEGYAFYAVHPLAYLEAARPLAGRLGVVIGLRSIGTSLAAAVAAGARLPRFMTVRPVGHPFSRSIAASPELTGTLQGVAGDIAIVDEGPGLSGSSFGAAADWLEKAGVARSRLVFFPSHDGEPGPQACERHRRRWSASRKVVPTWTVPPAEALADAIGRPSRCEDFSGGRWRERLNLDAPADPPRERLKFRITTPDGRYLLKFAGHGVVGEEKLEMARALHDAAFGPEPLALIDGFIATRWVDGEPGVKDLPRGEIVGHLGRYLAFRAAAFPAPADAGAPLPALVDMARHNLLEAGTNAAAELDNYDLDRLSRGWRPVRIDGRLHAWEWIVDPHGRLLKLDSLDHHAAHDLIGCQDIAWDLAGAIVEFDLDAGEQAEVLHAFGHPVDPEALSLARLLYLGFQVGLWTMALDAAAA